jgi:hypothetical protein
MMGDREAQKKAWELEQGALVARHLNASQGADYEARVADAEPADVALISPTGRYAAKTAQVVSIPLDFRSRDDKQTVSRMQEKTGSTSEGKGHQ